jgi:hypothetical protein
MPKHDATARRTKAQEEDWFREREEAARAQLRAQREAAARRERLAAALELAHGPLLERLEALGVTAENAAAFRVLPLVEVASADGRVDEAERRALLEAAAEAGVVFGSEAHATLEAWLERPPGEALFEACRAWSRPERSDRLRGLLARARDVAACSGGLLGLGRVSRAEQRVLERLAAAVPVDARP